MKHTCPDGPTVGVKCLAKLCHKLVIYGMYGDQIEYPNVICYLTVG